MGAITRDFAQLADNGSSNQQNVPLSGDYLFFATGTFGGGTVTLEASPDSGTTWYEIATATVKSRTKVFLGTGEIVRVTLSGATAPALDSGLR
jgi:hypothetical protein